MNTISSGYIIDLDGYNEFLKLYHSITHEFGECWLVVGSKLFKDLILFKSYIEDQLIKKHYYWVAIQIELA